MTDIACSVGLAVFAVVVMLRHTDGPLDIFWKIRDRYVTNKDTFFANWFSCHWCMATWISIIPVTILCTSRYIIPAEGLIVWLGSIGVAGILSTAIEVIYGPI